MMRAKEARASAGGVAIVIAVCLCAVLTGLLHSCMAMREAQVKSQQQAQTQI